MISYRHILLALAVLFGFFQAMADNSTKAERNAIKHGVEAYQDGNYAKALKYFDEALKESPTSETAKFNRASAMYRLGDADSTTHRVKDAIGIYETLGKSAADAAIRDKANYNLGNIAFHQQQYAQSIEYYKRVLRHDPSNIRARENLLVAELKLQQQQQDQQDQQDQEQEQEQEQEQQPQEQPQEPEPQDQQPQDPQPQPMSQNAEQILQTMQQRENQTREQTNRQARPAVPHSTDKPW